MLLWLLAYIAVSQFSTAATCVFYCKMAQGGKPFYCGTSSVYTKLAHVVSAFIG